jgi:hypothetical protein
MPLWFRRSRREDAASVWDFGWLAFQSRLPYTPVANLKQNFFSPMHFQVLAETARQVTDLLAIRGQSNFRDRCREQTPAP